MQNSSDTVSRRALLGAGSAAVLTLALPMRAAALTTDQAVALIQKVVTETLQVVNSNVSEPQAYRAFEQILARYGDIPVIARSVLGPPWRTATPAQQRAFVEAFQAYVARKYGAEFREYRGSTMVITGARDMGDKGVIVNTMVDIPGDPPFAVDWQVSDRSGQPKMVNLYIEGVSMLSTERSEVGAILEANRGSIDALIADLRARG